MPTTQVLTINPAQIDPAAIQQAADLIRAGQLVAFPTETVYGLGANALDSEAVARIFEAKGRPATDPIIVHIQSADQLNVVADNISALAHQLIEKFWPGPLTLILNKSAKIPANVSAGLPTVAVRMPSHPIAQALIKASGVPIAAPSANLFSHPSPTNAHHVLDDLNGKIPLILDGGSTPLGIESTIIDLTTDPPRLLRPGGLSLEALTQIIPNIETVTHYARPEDGSQPAPGLMQRHYAPRAEVRLLDGADGDIRRAMLKLSTELLNQGKSVGLLIANDDKNALPGLDNSVQIVTLGPLHDLDKIAEHLYDGLRKLDARNVEVILARAYPKTGIGSAIWDRLSRAAEGRVIEV